MNDFQTLRKVTDRDPRYPIEAYLFVIAALDYTRRKFKKEKHVTGQELCAGIKELALTHYGAMAKLVLEHWGITQTLDFGNIVYNMIEEKILSKTDEDSIQDFLNIYDFKTAFVNDYAIEPRGLKHGG